MTEDELREFLRSQGWIFQFHPTGDGDYDIYAFSVHNQRNVFICHFVELPELTAERVAALLKEQA